MRSKALAKASTSGKQAVEDTKKLLTDRGAYISFLEIQLERVSAACLHTQSLESQIHDMHVQLEATDAKITTVTKLLKMHQQHTGDLMQSNTQDIGTMQSLIETIRDTVTTHGTQLRRLDARQCDVDEAVHSIEMKLRCEIDTSRLSAENALETMELHVQRYHTLHEAQQHKWQALTTAQEELERDVGLVEARCQTHTDTAIGHFRDDLSAGTAALDAARAEADDKIKRMRQSVEQHCAVEVARAACAVDAKLESMDQAATLLQDQVQRTQQKLAQLGQKHHDDCRLLNATILSLQGELEEHTATHGRGVSARATSGGASTAHTEARVLQLERDYKICREGLEYLRHVMETFETAQMTLTDEWNVKLTQLEATSKGAAPQHEATQEETWRREMEDAVHATERRLVAEWCRKEEGWWKAVAALELQVPLLRDKVQCLMERSKENDPVLIDGVGKSLARVHRLERKMQRVSENMQTLYTLVEMAIPQKEKALGEFQASVMDELTRVRDAIKYIMDTMHKTSVTPLPREEAVGRRRSVKGDKVKTR
ncbi:Aste57867_19404 [Aphanomyces stellatus]|uniref:Aste57867_19404 protein n=1 Tax=Aphanomyces stellatus TaxID=120398 RepID=A0A485LD97_9STRA|nr:hypothetical protein As57867_019340 [Aphanomyces stellatus]VFT96118.1 Aste57867_19404 [Aphanomyces stellatus]